MLFLDLVSNIKRVGTKLVIVYNDQEVYKGTFSSFKNWVHKNMYVSKFVDCIYTDENMLIVQLED